MTTAIIDSPAFSGERDRKAVAKKRVHTKEASLPPRKYDNFESALNDVKEGRISRFDSETFTKEIKEELRRAK